MILVPRPAPHLPRTLAALGAAGLTQLQPLALSHPQSLPVTLSPAITALIFTSPFGILPGLPKLPAYCVGQTTAAAARAAGHPIAYTGTHNGVSMAKDLTTLPPQHFAHLHGDHATLDWHTILQSTHHQLTPIQAYRTLRITALPASVTSLPPITLLFSAGSARHLANLLKHANIQPNGTAICLSPAVAHAAQSFWPRVVTAAQPNLQAMVATIRHLQG